MQDENKPAKWLHVCCGNSRSAHAAPSRLKGPLPGCGLLFDDHCRFRRVHGDADCASIARHELQLVGVRFRAEPFAVVGEVRPARPGLDVLELATFDGDRAYALNDHAEAVLERL